MNKSSDDRERDVLRLVRAHLDNEADGADAAAVVARIMHTRATRWLRARIAFAAAALAASIAVLFIVTPRRQVVQPLGFPQLSALVRSPVSGAAIGLDAARECIRQAADLQHIIPSPSVPVQPTAGGLAIEMLKSDAQVIRESVNRLIIQSLSDAGLIS